MYGKGLDILDDVAKSVGAAGHIRTPLAPLRRAV
jgi:hypothetical protein